MTVAIFDLDDTILQGDSATLWGGYMVNNALVTDVKAHHEQNQQFDQDYAAGCLDVMAYLKFVVKPLTTMHPDDLLIHSHLFVEKSIRPLIRPLALDKLRWHKKQGHRVIIATSTINFIATPIADICGADALISTELEQVADHFTGVVVGEPTYGVNKVTALKQWMSDHDESWTNSYGYSDSHVDLPLLSAVQNPVAVNPDTRLKAHATETGWQIIDFSMH